MSQLTALDPLYHDDLKVVPENVLAMTAKQHLINLRVSEVGQAVCCCPVFLTHINESADWALSALSGFEVGVNLLMDDSKWDASYMPVSLQTMPFYLMHSDEHEHGYAIGIDAKSDVFSKTEGELVFSENGVEGILVSRARALLEKNLNDDLHTYKFIQTLNEYGLIKPVDLLIYQADETINTLRGLHTIDEDRLRQLNADELSNLHSKQYLPPIYAMLISIFQVNELIRRHNRLNSENIVKQIKIQIQRDLS